jgi:hypothetical protein
MFQNQIGCDSALKAVTGSNPVGSVNKINELNSDQRLDGSLLPLFRHFSAPT